jgi:cytochrome P450
LPWLTFLHFANTAVASITMALSDFLPAFTLANIVVAITVYLLLWAIYCRTLHPLAKVPGPLWPALSRTWLMYHIYLGDVEIAEKELHARYGKLVRIAPNEVSSADPAHIPVIYRTANALAKSDYYPTMRPQGISSQADLFTDTDEKHHASYRKIVSPAYQLSSVLKNEAAIDECTVLFIQRMAEFANQRKQLDLGHYLEMYGYDVIGRVLYGQMFGFLETNTDVGNWIESVAGALPLLTFAAVAPSYARTPIMIMGLLVPGVFKAVMAVNNITAQAKEQTRLRMKDSDEDNAKRHDILSQLFRIIREKKTSIEFTHKEVTLESWVGIIAGSDSVAITLRSVLYQLMKHPSSLAKVVAEIESKDAEGLLSHPVQFSETTTHLPYMCACIKESARVFPAFAIQMARVSPPEGLELSGHYLPAGYRAGINAAVVQRDRGIFGADAETFRPERWLESDEKNFALEKGMLNFGAGTRTCSGKNVSAL